MFLYILRSKSRSYFSHISKCSIQLWKVRQVHSSYKCMVKFTYKKAICRHIPRSIVKDGLRMGTSNISINYKTAVQQHEAYISTLEKAGIDVTILPTDESLPDCVFVEDTAVVIGNRVLITNPGAPSRRNETKAVRKVFEREENMEIYDMKPPAILDGGDVLFTGQEIFVGLSKRTNEEGLVALKEIFKDYDTHGTHIGNSTLHLKSLMTMVDNMTIACSMSDTGRKIAETASKISSSNYNILFVPDDLAANCVLFNGNLICQTRDRFPESIKKYDELPVNILEIESTELEKVDGALTCCSLLY